MKILVTGSSGTIGTRLCEKLMEKGHEVIGLDIKPNQWNKEVDAITIKADMRKIDFFDKLPNDINMVVHLAANALVYPLVVEPSLAMDNSLMVFNSLEFCKKNNIKSYIFASSREVYGNTDKIEHSEDDVRVDHAESPYSATKLGSEALVRAYENCYGINFVIIRFSNVYGMYDSSDRLLPKCIRRAKVGDGLEVYGNEKMLDFTYIDDAINGVISAIGKFQNAKNEAYNLATGSGSTILYVVEKINELLGRKSQIKITVPRLGEVIKYIAVIDKAKSKLGYNPKVDIDEGIEKTIEWYGKNGF